MTAERIAELRARWTKPPNPVVIELLDELDIIANLERERDAATERLASAKALDAQARTDWDRLTRELEAERSGAAAMREALTKCRTQAWAAQLGNPIDLVTIGNIADHALESSTAGTEMLERLRKAEANKPVVGNDLQKLALRERIATLEAALEEARKAIDPFYRFACMRLALPPKNQLGDNAPLRNVLPGSWPTVADLNTLHAAHERIKRLIPEGKP